MISVTLIGVGLWAAILQLTDKPNAFGHQLASQLAMDSKRVRTTYDSICARE